MSFSRAAQELHVTPAAVGQQVRTLESYLGETLFVRLNRSVELTVAGQALLPGCERWLRPARAYDGGVLPAHGASPTDGQRRTRIRREMAGPSP